MSRPCGQLDKISYNTITILKFIIVVYNSSRLMKKQSHCTHSLVWCMITFYKHDIRWTIIFSKKNKKKKMSKLSHNYILSYKKLYNLLKFIKNNINVDFFNDVYYLY
jgi:hypothetical protein